MATRRRIITGAAAIAGAAMLPSAALGTADPPCLVRNMDGFRFNLRVVRGYALELAATFADTFESHPDHYAHFKRTSLLDAFAPHLDSMERALRRENHTAPELRSARNAFLRSISLSRRAIAEAGEGAASVAFGSALLKGFTARMMRENAKLDPPDHITPTFFDDPTRTA